MAPGLAGTPRPPPTASSDRGEVPAPGMATEASFSILLKKPQIFSAGQ